MKAEWLRMKAKELRIGDWMMFDGDYVQIVKVESDVRYWDTEGKVTILNARGKWVDSDIDNIEPIPITAEILEENAFERVQDIFVLMWKNGVYPSMIFIEYIPTNYCLYINDMLLPKPVLYIHELQHILSMCGLDKEIAI